MGLYRASHCLSVRLLYTLNVIFRVCNICVQRYIRMHVQERVSSAMCMYIALIGFTYKRKLFNFRKYLSNVNENRVNIYLKR